MPSLIFGRSIAIVGAGPVGLVAAKILQLKGAAVRVYERDASPSARITGGTLDIHRGTGQDALAEASLLEVYFERSRAVREISADQSGTILSEDIPKEAEVHERPEIDRNDLRSLALESLNPETVAWGSQVMDISKQERGYQLELRDGSKATADLVIVANGGATKLRQLVTDAMPEYTGSFVIQGEISKPTVSCRDFISRFADANVVVLSEEKVLSIQTKGSGAIVFYVSFRAPEDWAQSSGVDLADKATVRDYLLKTFAHWSPAYQQLFRASEFFTPLPMKKLPLLQWKTHDAITLIGDAAHLMPPFAGEGVNMGLLDAYYLCRYLTNGEYGSIHDAIAAYEAKMKEYAGHAQFITTLLEQKSHAENALQEILALKSGHH